MAPYTCPPRPSFSTSLSYLSSTFTSIPSSSLFLSLFYFLHDPPALHVFFLPIFHFLSFTLTCLPPLPVLNLHLFSQPSFQALFFYLHSPLAFHFLYFPFHLLTYLYLHLPLFHLHLSSPSSSQTFLYLCTLPAFHILFSSFLFLTHLLFPLLPYNLNPFLCLLLLLPLFTFPFPPLPFFYLTSHPLFSTLKSPSFLLLSTSPSSQIPLTIYSYLLHLNLPLPSPNVASPSTLSLALPFPPFLRGPSPCHRFLPLLYFFCLHLIPDLPFQFCLLLSLLLLSSYSYLL